MDSLIPTEIISSRIYMLRGQKIILDRDLAIFFDVETRVLKQAIKRNINRFPEDFMFILTESEIWTMVSHFVIPSKSYFWWWDPMAFTEHGCLMLASVLRSEKAINMSIAIIRVFTQMRKILESNEFLYQKLQSIESRLWEYDEEFGKVWFQMQQLLRDDERDEKRIWFLLP